MSRPDESDDLLPAGVAKRERALLTALYRGPTATVECVECTGTGRYTRPAGFPGGRPQQFVCATCRGSGRVSA